MTSVAWSHPAIDTATSDTFPSDWDDPCMANWQLRGRADGMEILGAATSGAIHERMAR